MGEGEGSNESDRERERARQKERHPGRERERVWEELKGWQWSAVDRRTRMVANDVEMGLTGLPDIDRKIM